MAMVGEFLGIAPLGSASIPRHARREGRLGRGGRRAGHGPARSAACGRAISSRARRFENAIAAVAATGGSTNAVLHLLAIAREAGVPLDIDDFDPVSERTPVLADLKPGGRYVAADLHRAGGAPLLAQRLFAGGFIDGRADRHRPHAGRRGRDARRDARAGGRPPARPRPSSRPAAW